MEAEGWMGGYLIQGQNGPVFLWVHPRPFPLVLLSPGPHLASDSIYMPPIPKPNSLVPTFLLTFSHTYPSVYLAATQCIQILLIKLICILGPKEWKPRQWPGPCHQSKPKSPCTKNASQSRKPNTNLSLPTQLS